MRVYCGLASAGQRIPVAVVDDAGRLLASDEVDDTPAGYAAVCTLIAERCTDTGPVRAAMATDSETSLMPLLLAASGEPLAVGDEGTIAPFMPDEPAGSSDPTRRAIALARALQAGTLSATNQPVPRDLTALRPVLTAHNAAAVGRSAAVAMLRDLLRELYPAALRAFPDPATPLAMAVLERLADPAQFSHGHDRNVAGQLHADGMPDAEAAVTRLRAAVASMSIRRSGAEAVGPVVRCGVAAVRSADNVASALLDVIAEHVEPRTGGRGFPAVPPTSAPPTEAAPGSGTPAPAPPISGPPGTPAGPLTAPVSASPPLTSQPATAPRAPQAQPPAPDAPRVPAQGAAGQGRLETPTGAPQEPHPTDAHPPLPQPGPPQPAASPPPAMLPPTRQPSGLYQQQPSSESPYRTPPATNGSPTAGPPAPGAWGGHTGAHRQVAGDSTPPPHDQTGQPQPPASLIPATTGSAVPDQSDEELSLLTPDELPTNPNLRRPAEPQPRPAEPQSHVEPQPRPAEPYSHPAEPQPRRGERPGDRLGALIEFPRSARRHLPDPSSSPYLQQPRRDTEDEPTQEYRPPSPRRQAPAAAPSSAPPLSDNDGDLLIFAQAQSAWFTGDGEPGNESDWRTDADVGWTAAEAASRPTVGGTTVSGLPRRVPSANLVPGTAPHRDRTHVHPVHRDAAQLAAHTAGYFRGWSRARQDAQEPSEYPSVRHQ